MPLGGIGTGTVSLGGRGDLRDWEIMNRPAKGYTPSRAFFAISVRDPSGGEYQRCLEGPIPPEDYEGAFGSTVPQHGLPRFAEAVFRTAYPLAQVELVEPGSPVQVRLEAMNPFVPADADASGVPYAMLRYRVANLTGERIDVAMCGSVPNIVGDDGRFSKAKGNRNRLVEGSGLVGVLLASEGVPSRATQWGTLALAAPEAGEITRRTAWAEFNWGDTLLDFWDDLADGRLDPREQKDESRPAGSVCVRRQLEPHGQAEFEFVLAWHFPNRPTWDDSDDAAVVRNHYADRFSDAWDVAQRAYSDHASAERKTVEFVTALLGSDAPEEVKEAALFNASTLRTQTCFRTPDGFLFGWEGCGDHQGCCEGSCTHVWNYEQATPFLFGELARGMRRVEFAHATREDGLMSFRVKLPLDSRAHEWQLAAADGQMGCLMKLFREWKLSGDDEFLRELWPGAKRALEFCWVPNGWDADADGVMEGCQHNTMDVEYYGPNPQMGGWYLGALRASEEMARHLGDTAFAEKCRRLFESGSKAMDSELFNGSYYEHKVQPPKSPPPSGLRHESMGARDYENPDLQLASGCLIDQLVGQYMAHVCGLGHLLDAYHVRTTLQTLMKRNYRESVRTQFNQMRSFALGDEPAMLMAWYPPGRRPERPFPYYNEVMTGFEYTAAAHMLYEGMTEEGLKVVHAIRSRYDGLRRNPFDEAECGHHYARAMASWACLLALSGFQYDGRHGTMTFAHAPRKSWFWSTGDAWGDLRVHGARADLTVHGGRVRVSELRVGDSTGNPKEALVEGPVTVTVDLKA